MTASGQKTVVVHSGGLDSSTLIYHLLDQQHEVRALTLDYRQRHSREIQAAEQVCAAAGVPHRIVRLPQLGELFDGNALTDERIDVPAGPYDADTIPATTVPNRNMIFLSVAIGWAAQLQFNAVAFGAHAGERTNYPDCRPEFSEAMNAVAALCHWTPIQVASPFVTWTKTEIVRRGLDLEVPFELTWSCYRGEQHHCGVCSTCHDRRSAFDAADAVDPVRFASAPRI